MFDMALDGYASKLIGGVEDGHASKTIEGADSQSWIILRTNAA